MDKHELIKIIIKIIENLSINKIKEFDITYTNYENDDEKKLIFRN